VGEIFGCEIENLFLCLGQPRQEPG
jgi:hypothetical protein